MVFPAERTHFFRVPIKLAHPFPAPELRTRILRTRGFFWVLSFQHFKANFCPPKIGTLEMHLPPHIWAKKTSSFAKIPGRNYIRPPPPSPPFLAKRHFPGEGGGGVYFEAPRGRPHAAGILYAPPFYTPPTPRRVFSGVGGWGCIKFGPVKILPANYLCNYLGWARWGYISMPFARCWPLGVLKGEGVHAWNRYNVVHWHSHRKTVHLFSPKWVFFGVLALQKQGGTFEGFGRKMAHSLYLYWFPQKEVSTGICTITGLPSGYG